MSDVFRLQPVGGNGESKPRGRSSIAFPYYDLRQSERLAKHVASNAGKCKPEQLAAWLGHRTLNSGAFRNRVSSAALFGLILSSRKQITLTDLGRRISDPALARGARVDAFLSPALYRRIYEDTRGRRLPPTMLLQQQMVELGVVPTQAAPARQVFVRSAEHAGFFEVSDDRLVEPKQVDFAAGWHDSPDEVSAPATESQGPTRYPPLIEAVLDQAPWGEGWSAEAFEDWSELLIRACRMHFGSGQGSSRR